MLAENRSRQKWSDDPRNTRWANDKSKFGYQMLTRMGWSEGKGLGQKEAGVTTHIKVKKRNSNAGVGSKHSHDDDWISHQTDFNDLLTALNQGKEGGDKKIKSLEDRVKLSKKKILYTKFVKSKDLSNASSHDLACIFGQRSKSAPATPQLSDDEAVDSDASAASCPVPADHVHEHGFTTVRTGVSVADYFTQKMLALKKAQEGEELVVDEGLVIDDHLTNYTLQKNLPQDNIADVEVGRSKKKKKKRSKKDTCSMDSEITVLPKQTKDDFQSDEEIRKSKKRKTKRKNDVTEFCELQKDVDSLTSEPKCKKKRKALTEEAQQGSNLINEDDQGNRTIKKKKKKRDTS